MQTVSATEAARRFSDLLDAVDARGESYLVVRRGRAVARIEPARAANGRALKELLRATPPDGRWSQELEALRESLAAEERSWAG